MTSIIPRRAMCSNCPFARQGPGAHLRSTLSRPARREIVNALADSGNFHCHSEIDYDSEDVEAGTGRQCAGAWSSAARDDVWGQAMRWADRLGTDVEALANLDTVTLAEFLTDEEAGTR